MEQNRHIQDDFRQLQCCVIIPAYNNAATLKTVIDGVLAYTDNIIVINDGSTDETANVLKEYENLNIIHFRKNIGKGYALRKAMKIAGDQGDKYAISIDADGQHFPSDLPMFIEKIKDNPQAMIVGSRNMSQEGVPGKSSFGNKFSNFWFYIETGTRIPDTQSGYRCYPLFMIRTMRFYGRKYEFEVEVLVRSSWKGIKIIPMPVGVYYPPEEERVSHFRPFTDFFRISVLNTVLVLYALLVIKPFRFTRSLTKENIKGFFQNEFVRSKDRDSKIVFSVMVGLFFGVAPIWGFQMIVALVLAVWFRLNKIITLVASNISIPPMIPVIIYLSYLLGGHVYTHDKIDLAYSSNITLETISINLLQYFAGSLLLGFLLAIAGGLITFVLLRVMRKKNVQQ